MSARLRASLVKHESYEKFPYNDGLGNTTIGIGYNLTARGISDEWINTQYQADVDYFYKQFCEIFSWFKDLNEDRQIVIIDMAFMGLKKLLEFKNMLSYLAVHDYENAADEMLNSAWAQQVRNRAVELAASMRAGVLLYL